MFSTMECQKAQFFVTILVILFGVSSSKNVCNPACKANESFNCDDPLTFNRTSFPKNFTFGAATSAYQVHISLLLTVLKDLYSDLLRLFLSIKTRPAWFIYICTRLKVQHIEHLTDGTITLIDIQVIKIIH